MSDIEEIIRNASLDNLIAYLLNESEPVNGKIEIGDKAIRASYTEFIEKLVELYPDVNKDNDKLFNAITEFASIHDEIYFKLGVIVGAGLVRELKEGNVGIKGLGIVKK